MGKKRVETPSTDRAFSPHSKIVSKVAKAMNTTDPPAADTEKPTAPRGSREGSAIRRSSDSEDSIDAILDWQKNIRPVLESMEKEIPIIYIDDDDDDNDKSCASQPHVDVPASQEPATDARPDSLHTASDVSVSLLTPKKTIHKRQPIVWDLQDPVAPHNSDTPSNNYQSRKGRVAMTPFLRAALGVTPPISERRIPSRTVSSLDANVNTNVSVLFPEDSEATEEFDGSQPVVSATESSVDARQIKVASLNGKLKITLFGQDDIHSNDLVTISGSNYPIGKLASGQSGVQSVGEHSDSSQPIIAFIPDGNNQLDAVDKIHDSDNLLGLFNLDRDVRDTVESILDRILVALDDDANITLPESPLPARSNDSSIIYVSDSSNPIDFCEIISPEIGTRRNSGDSGVFITVPDGCDVTLPIDKCPAVVTDFCEESMQTDNRDADCYSEPIPTENMHSDLPLRGTYIPDEDENNCELQDSESHAGSPLGSDIYSSSDLSYSTSELSVVDSEGEANTDEEDSIYGSDEHLGAVKPLDPKQNQDPSIKMEVDNDSGGSSGGSPPVLVLRQSNVDSASSQQDDCERRNPWSPFGTEKQWLEFAVRSIDLAIMRDELTSKTLLAGTTYIPDTACGRYVKHLTDTTYTIRLLRNQFEGRLSSLEINPPMFPPSPPSPAQPEPRRRRKSGVVLIKTEPQEPEPELGNTVSVSQPLKDDEDMASANGDPSSTVAKESAIRRETSVASGAVQECSVQTEDITVEHNEREVPPPGNVPLPPSIVPEEPGANQQRESNGNVPRQSLSGLTAARLENLSPDLPEARTSEKQAVITKVEADPEPEKEKFLLKLTIRQSSREVSPSAREVDGDEAGNESEDSSSPAGNTAPLVVPLCPLSSAQDFQEFESRSRTPSPLLIEGRDELESPAYSPRSPCDEDVSSSSPSPPPPPPPPPPPRKLPTRFSQETMRKITAQQVELQSQNRNLLTISTSNTGARRVTTEGLSDFQEIPASWMDNIPSKGHLGLFPKPKELFPVGGIATGGNIEPIVSSRLPRKLPEVSPSPFKRPLPGPGAHLPPSPVPPPPPYKKQKTSRWTTTVDDPGSDVIETDEVPVQRNRTSFEALHNRYALLNTYKEERSSDSRASSPPGTALGRHPGFVARKPLIANTPLLQNSPRRTRRISPPYGRHTERSSRDRSPSERRVRNTERRYGRGVDVVPRSSRVDRPRVVVTPERARTNSRRIMSPDSPASARNSRGHNSPDKRREQRSLSRESARARREFTYKRGAGRAYRGRGSFPYHMARGRNAFADRRNQ